MKKFFPKGWVGRTVPQLQFSKLPELSETGRARKLIFGLQVNIDMANSRRKFSELLPVQWLSMDKRNLRK